jgi:hypothetical protein
MYVAEISSESEFKCVKANLPFGMFGKTTKTQV